MDIDRIRNINNDNIWEIQEFLTDQVKGGGGRKSKSQGKKTVRTVIKSQKENAVKRKRKEAELSLVKDLKHFPIKNLNKEQIPGALDFYADWVVKSLEQGYPCISNIDDDIEFSQTKSSGPGGQNVNKVSTAVIAKHLLTGISARSDGREMLINRRESLEKIMRILEGHIEDWRVYLKVDSSKRVDQIKKLIYSAILS